MFRGFFFLKFRLDSDVEPVGGFHVVLPLWDPRKRRKVKS